MKKTFYLTTAVLAVISITSCSGTKKSGSEPAETRSQQEVYSGILPAADADGIKYTLKLDYSSDPDFKSGIYDLEESYLMVDSLSSDGIKTIQTDNSNGNFTIFEGEGSNSGKYYLKLVDQADSIAATPVFFLVENDSTITMVNAELEPSPNPDFNYSLTLQ